MKNKLIKLTRCFHAKKFCGEKLKTSAGTYLQKQRLSSETSLCVILSPAVVDCRAVATPILSEFTNKSADRPASLLQALRVQCPPSKPVLSL